MYVIVVYCEFNFARARFITRRRTSTDDIELFDKRKKEYSEKTPAILEHYRDIIINVSENI